MHFEVIRKKLTVGTGLLIGSLVSQRYGRRVCIFSMSCYALVTATITVTSQSKGQILAARILNCMTSVQHSLGILLIPT